MYICICGNFNHSLIIIHLLLAAVVNEHYTQLVATPMTLAFPTVYDHRTEEHEEVVTPSIPLRESSTSDGEDSTSDGKIHFYYPFTLTTVQRYINVASTS